MSIIESVVSAVQSVLSNKMRSILTMIGIIIGIGSVIMITSIGQGFQNGLNEDLSKLGVNSLEVRINYNEEIKSKDRLTIADMDVLRSHPEVVHVAPLYQSQGNVKLKNPNETQRCILVGSNEDFRYIQEVDIVYGRFLMDVDVNTKSPVAIIDEDISKKIFGRADSVGEKINFEMWFGTMELTVIGISKSVSLGAMFTYPTMIYVPITTVSGFSSDSSVDYFYVSTKSIDSMDRTATELATMLSLKHGNENKYYVDNMMKQMDTINSVLGGATAFIGLVAAISLLVGGIGVMNIMLVTVTERTREIGIRKSLGATNGNIQFQFLVEAIILTAIGGLLGILLGYFGGFALGGLIDITPVISVPTVIGTFIISSAIGIVFGVYPAGKAAQLDPIEALRYE